MPRKQQTRHFLTINQDFAQFTLNKALINLIT